MWKSTSNLNKNHKSKQYFLTKIMHLNLNMQDVFDKFNANYYLKKIRPQLLMFNTLFNQKN